MGPQVDSINTIVQKVILKCTVAAAATGIGASLSGAHRGPPRSLVLDRPYLLVIQDTKTGTPLFATRVGNPPDERRASLPPHLKIQLLAGSGQVRERCR